MSSWTSSRMRWAETELLRKEGTRPTILLNVEESLALWDRNSVMVP